MPPAPSKRTRAYFPATTSPPRRPGQSPVPCARLQLRHGCSGGFAVIASSGTVPRGLVVGVERAALRLAAGAHHTVAAGPLQWIELGSGTTLGQLRAIGSEGSPS